MEELTFIADVMLGKLSKWLRILGFDTLYSREQEIDTLLFLAIKEKRHILTRKTSLNDRDDLKDRLFFIKDNNSMNQLKEVIEHYNLQIKPNNIFTRCLICNQKLKGISPELAQGKVPEYIANTEKSFSLCPQCKRIFWKGTHLKNILQKINKLLSNDTSHLSSPPSPTSDKQR
jgi:uncharacterized protein with PIN domain